MLAATLTVAKYIMDSSEALRRWLASARVRGKLEATQLVRRRARRWTWAWRAVRGARLLVATLLQL